ncbi:MAG: GAF domain-containing protein [Candidatus Dormibacteraeota bacterium]|nr:GAF domain-containing protein [Candidatus Dormibacteraeota bacterium]
METVSRVEAGFWEQFETFQSVSADLARFSDLDQVVERALELTFELTGSSAAFIALADDTGGPKLYSRAATPSDALSSDEIARMVEQDSIGRSLRSINVLNTFCSQPLQAGGTILGTIGIVKRSGFTAVQRRAFSLFANPLASAIEISRLHQRRQEMVDALVNLRAELDRSEAQRLLNEERARSAERLEKAHELAVEALLAVSVHARLGHDLTDFYRRLTSTMAQLVGAEKVLFWQVNENRTLTAIPGAHGIDDAFVARFNPTPCAEDGDDLASRVVYKDHIYRASRADADPDSIRILDVLGVSTALSVPWRAGDRRLGLVAAYDSHQPDGFSREDAWVLHKAALAAGLVWQLRQAETDLKKTVERLQKVDNARQLLLKNVSAAADKIRHRFATELHDDALQKLTAAELHLQRVSPQRLEPVANATDLLRQAEEALRRLLFEVRPPALELPGGFEETIRDRLLMLRSLTGIEADVELELDDEVPYELKSLVFRQVAEAVTNVEKHAAATRVEVKVKVVDGGIQGLVLDNGRGFVVEERDHLPGHLGLLALNERALLTGGWCKISSAPGKGCRVEFWFPVPA